MLHNDSDVISTYAIVRESSQQTIYLLLRLFRIIIYNIRLEAKVTIKLFFVSK